MIGGLSAYSPGTIAGFGSAGGIAPTVFRDENGKEQQGSTIQPAPARPVAPAFGVGRSGVGLASGQTLMTAQEQGGSSQGEAKAPGQLSEEEKQQVAKLKQTDAKVRAHERAHAAVGGQYAGAPSYSYTRGPDGQLYAVSGEVAIDIGAESDPEATLQKASQVAAAALAPADLSGADRAVAAAAAQLRLQALAQIRAEKRAEQEAAAAEEDVPETLPGQRAVPETGSADGEAGRAPQGGGDTPAAGAAGAYSQAAGRASSDNGAADRRIGGLIGLTA